MKHFFFGITLVISMSCLAQNDERNTSSGNSIWKFEAGYTNFRPYRLNDLLNSSGSKTPFTALRTFGITYGGTLTTVGDLVMDGSYDGAFSLHFFQPQSSVVKPDTLEYKIGGWELMTSLYGFDLLKKVRAVDFVIGPGIFWGTMRIRKYNSTGNFRANELFKNPFFAPMIRADLRVNIGPVTLGARWSYRHDTTKSKWRKGSSEILPGYRCREMQYIVYVGYRLYWNDN